MLKIEKRRFIGMVFLHIQNYPILTEVLACFKKKDGQYSWLKITGEEYPDE